MAKRYPSYPIVVAAVDPHSLCFTSPGVKSAPDRQPDGNEGATDWWALSGVRWNLQQRVNSQFPATADGASVRWPRLRDVLRWCRRQVGLQSLTVAAGFFYVQDQLKNKECTSVCSSRPDKLCRGVCRDVISLHKVRAKLGAGVWEMCFRDLKANI